MAKPGVEFRAVTYTLPGNRTLLHDISLTLESNTTTALLGRSGSGKTTLLRMVNALVTPGTGQVLVDGTPITETNQNMLRRSIGYVIQETGLFPHMSVERNAGLSLELAGRPKPEIAARAAELLALTGLSPDLSRRYPWQLSGGQRQRVGLARALATDPTVLLMDEPFGALDPITRAEMQTMLKDLLANTRKAAHKTTVLLVTHDLDEALYLAQRILFLDAGRLAADLRPEDVPTSQIPYVRDYVAAVHRA